MITKAQRYAALVGRIPFVEKVSLTGSLAQGRASAGSDIDFFVQVKPRRLYLTRLLVTGLLEFMGARRRGSQIAGQICLNWFATFDGPLQQGRPDLLLWQRSSPVLRPIERLLQGMLGDWLEMLAKQLQQARFKRDPRTRLPGSQVRFSDQELGFHPPKGF